MKNPSIFGKQESSIVACSYDTQISVFTNGKVAGYRFVPPGVRRFSRIVVATLSILTCSTTSVIGFTSKTVGTAYIFAFLSWNQWIVHAFQWYLMVEAKEQEIELHVGKPKAKIAWVAGVKLGRGRQSADGKKGDWEKGRTDAVRTPFCSFLRSLANAKFPLANSHWVTY